MTRSAAIRRAFIQGVSIRLSLLGGYFNVPKPGDLHERMAGAMSYPGAIVQQQRGDRWGLCTVDPGVASKRERIAVSEDGQVAVGVAGYLLDAGYDGDRRPARYCLDLYEQYGEALPEHLNGGFTIAIIDCRKNILLLITDHVSTSPFYYWSGEGYVFASAAKGILAHRAVSGELDRYRAGEFLMTGQSAEPGTLYRDIRQVPGAAVMEFQDGQVRERVYWRLPAKYEEDMTLDEAATLIATVVSSAVQRACPPGRRHALMLGAGLDARFIGACMPSDTECVTLHQFKAREVRLAGRVAQALGLRHTYWHLPPTFPLDIMEEGTETAEGRYAFSHAHSLVLRPWLEERGIQALTIGIGVDVFRGLYMPAAKLCVGGHEVKLPRLVSPDDGYLLRYVLRRSNLSGKHMAAVMREPTAQDVEERTTALVAACEEQAQEQGSARVDLPMYYWCPCLCLMRSHLNALALGRVAEAGLPYFDREVMATVVRIPPQHRFGARAYLQALAMINPAVARIPRSPTGVSPLCNDWLAAANEHSMRLLAYALRRLNGPLRGWLPEIHLESWPLPGVALYATDQGRNLMRAFAADSVVCDLGFLHQEALQDIVENHISRKQDATRFLLNWLTLEQWLRTHN